MTLQVRLRDTLFLSHCAYSPGVWFRMKGLLGKKSLAEGEGLWLKPCNAVHMFGMKFAIDAIFLDKENKVLRVFENLRPWQATPIVWNAHSVLETPAGTAQKAGLKPGDVLEFTE